MMAKVTVLPPTKRPAWARFIRKHVVARRFKGVPHSIEPLDSEIDAHLASWHRAQRGT